MIFFAENYLTRKDLDRAISAELGQDIKANKEAGHIIQGTKENLKKLCLDDNCSVFGCKIAATDISTTAELKDKIKEKGKKWAMK